MAKTAKTVLLPALLSVLLLPLSSIALTQDFCVADLARGDTPSGYPCKAESNVTADDFYYAGLATPGNITAPFGVGLGQASVQQFPGVNGLGISATRVDFTEGGVVPLHTHPRATELLFVVKGSLIAGFISASSNTVYIKTLCEGEIFVFPLGMLHFQYNAGPKTAVAFAAYSSANPGLQIVDYALFANNLRTNVVQNVTFLDALQVKKLMALFGGSG